jgi:DNA-directed RNA polymerase specialized sigma subunit
LFFEDRTEREVAELMGIYRNAVHKQKKRILHKLKNILKKF